MSAGDCLLNCSQAIEYAEKKNISTSIRNQLEL